MREKLIELIKARIENKTWCVSALADYLIANGVVVLPFEIGQTLYDASEFYDGTEHPEIYELKSYEMSIDKLTDDIWAFTYDGCFIDYDDIGKTVFLTREEAEAKLRENNGKK